MVKKLFLEVLNRFERGRASKLFDELLGSDPNNPSSNLDNRPQLFFMRILLIILGIIVLALQYRLWFADDGLTQFFSLKKEIKTLEEKNKKIEERNTSLSREIASLKKGGDAIESRARNDLGMVKEGEVYYQVVK